ncbi:uncharacterized protein LOC107480166 [Arachis duranensis]|uniref:Uncharacterized protein LOC107480166 n=1 Tax=Arachis duranensis TaxID=130453 RepID=A0A6P4CQT7_ARADU|nr:uncharacterized protein LOC107480166 [Arachis duranensis]
MATCGRDRTRTRRENESKPSTYNHAELVVAMTNLSNTIQAGTAIAAHAFWRIRQSVGSEKEEGAEDSLVGVPRTLAAFLKVDPPIFNGSTNPIEADNWFKAVDGRSSALVARRVSIPATTEYGYSMGDFQTIYYKKYFPESVREARELELMQLKQGSMLVAEYMSKFKELCRFSRVCQGAPESYEGWKCKKYQVGLREDIMRVVALFEIK